MALRSRTLVFLAASAITLLACPTGALAGCCCPTFWTAFDHHCYRLFSQNLTWNRAERFCQSYTVPSLSGEATSPDTMAHLVSIHSQAEQNFVNILYESSRRKSSDTIDIRGGLWFGLHDQFMEGDFKWSDGSPFDYNAWAPGQPDFHTRDENCGVIRSDFNSGLWRDGPCVQPPSMTINYFICKLPMW
ncbi:echinoidin-like [Lytechinus variegatus]|uniref:echinoidin-like n=1 Tax=Lytechinus variegatus TaxID=7654 RepID=UPI001BB166AE|nr:echinoidin-like [Lytechinus variegatus]